MRTDMRLVVFGVSVALCSSLASAQNLLVNGDFQTGNLSGWSRGNASGRGGFTLGTPTSTPGWWPNPFGYGLENNPDAYFIHTGAGQDDGWIYQAVTVTPNVDYIFSALVAGEGSSTAQLWYAAGNTWSGLGAGEIRLATQTVGGNAWSRIRGRFRPATNTVTVILRIFDAGGGVACADNLSLRPASARAATIADDMNGVWTRWDEREDSGLDERATPFVEDYDAPWWCWRGPWVAPNQSHYPVWPGAWKQEHTAGQGPAADPNGMYVSVGGVRALPPNNLPLGGIARDFDNLAPGEWKLVLWANDMGATSADGHRIWLCARVISTYQGGWTSDDYIAQSSQHAFSQTGSGHDWGSGWVQIDSSASNMGAARNRTFTVAEGDFVRFWCYSESRDLGRRQFYALDYVQLVPVNVAVCDSDLDGDLVCDAQEAYPPAAGQTNRLLRDSDLDGLSDGEEDTNRNGQRDTGETNARHRDSDGDNWTDGVEVRVLSSNPLSAAAPGALADADGDRLPDSHDPDNTKADADGDRYRDWYEAALGGAPNNAAIKPGLGDVNKDNAVSNADALITNSLFLGNITPSHPAWRGDGYIHTDPSGDGQISNADALLIQSFFLGNLALLPLQ